MLCVDEDIIVHVTFVRYTASADPEMVKVIWRVSSDASLVDLWFTTVWRTS